MAMSSTGISMVAVAKYIGYYAFPLYLSLLCKHSNINKWSKWKPVNSTASTMTASVLQGTWYGLRNVYSTSTSSIGGWLSGGTLYTYSEKPTGTSSSPFRLGDFRNYNHSAPVPYTYTFNKRDGYRNSYYISASLANGADITMEDMFPASAHTGSSIVLIDRPRKTGASVSVYTLSNTAVTNNAYNSFAGYFTTSSSANTQYWHDCGIGIKDGSTYYMLPAEPFSWFQPLETPQISFDGGTTWANMEATGGEITIYQNRGNYASIQIRTGFPLDVYNGANWISTSASAIPPSYTNPPTPYEIEIILDTATSSRYANVSFSNSDYAFNYALKVNQSVMNPSVSVECIDFHQTTGLSREAIFNVVNTSGIVGALATFYFRYTTSGGGVYTTEKTITVPINDSPVTLAVTFEADGTSINSAKIQNTATNINQITFISNNKMDGSGNIVISV